MNDYLAGIQLPLVVAKGGDFRSNAASRNGVKKPKTGKNYYPASRAKQL